MKIDFEDGSSVELKKSEKSDNYFIIIKAKDYENPLRKIVNSVELTNEQLMVLIKDIT